MCEEVNFVFLYHRKKLIDLYWLGFIDWCVYAYMYVGD